jgi:hypothetical protein
MAEAQDAKPGKSQGKAGEDYQSDQSELEQLEHAVDSLGTAQAGAGPNAASAKQSHLPPGSDHHDLEPGAQHGFTYRSDQGELTALEEGTVLTEEGEAEAREGGGEVY